MGPLSRLREGNRRALKDVGLRRDRMSRRGPKPGILTRLEYGVYFAAMPSLAWAPMIAWWWCSPTSLPTLLAGGYEKRWPGCGSSHSRRTAGNCLGVEDCVLSSTTLSSAGKSGAVCKGAIIVGVTSELGMTCNPYNGLLLLLPGGASLIGRSISEPADAVLVLCARLLRPLRLRPSLAPIFFQPLLCALMARCRLLGDVLKAQSDVGGVVGGVMGSLPDGDPVLAVSSESPNSRSTTSPDDDPDRFP